jgi:hypothetical protein
MHGGQGQRGDHSRAALQGHDRGSSEVLHLHRCAAVWRSPHLQQGACIIGAASTDRYHHF